MKLSHCIGATDWKHITMECHQNAESACFSFKYFHSLVLVAVCDANHCLITLIDNGDYVSNNDLRILSETISGEVFEHSPSIFNLPNTSLVKSKMWPYLFIEHNKFFLRLYLIKRLPDKILRNIEFLLSVIFCTTYNWKYIWHFSRKMEKRPHTY